MDTGGRDESSVVGGECICVKIQVSLWSSKASQEGTCFTVWWLQCLQTGIQENGCVKQQQGRRYSQFPRKTCYFSKYFPLSCSENTVPGQWRWVPGGSRVLGTNFLRGCHELLRIIFCAMPKGVTAYQFFLLTSLSTILLVINRAVMMIYGPCCIPTCFRFGVFKSLELTFCDSKLLINYWGLHCVYRG